MVVVTPTESVADVPFAPAIVNVQLPAATGVTVKVVPLLGEIVAIPLHVAVEALKLPPNCDCEAVVLSAYAAPVAVKLSAEGVRATAPGVGTGLGVGIGVDTVTANCARSPNQSLTHIVVAPSPIAVTVKEPVPERTCSGLRATALAWIVEGVTVATFAFVDVSRN